MDGTLVFQDSQLLSFEKNVRVNKINFYLEVFLTVAIYSSSLLVLSIEKDWWGGYLTHHDSDQNQAHNFQDYLKNGKQMYKENPAYVYENTLRLIIVGCAVSSFCTLLFIDVVQIIFTTIRQVEFYFKKLVSQLRNNESIENR